MKSKYVSKCHGSELTQLHPVTITDDDGSEIPGLNTKGLYQAYCQTCGEPCEVVSAQSTHDEYVSKADASKAQPDPIVAEKATHRTTEGNTEVE